MELQIQLIAWKVKALIVLFSEALPVSLGLTVRGGLHRQQQQLEHILCLFPQQPLAGSLGLAFYRIMKKFKRIRLSQGIKFTTPTPHL